MRPDADARHGTDPDTAVGHDPATGPSRAIPMPGNDTVTGAHEHVPTGPGARQVPDHSGPDRGVPEPDLPAAPKHGVPPEAADTAPTADRDGTDSVEDRAEDAEALTGATDVHHDNDVDTPVQEPAPPLTREQDLPDAVGVAKVPVHPAGAVYGSGDAEPLLPAGYHDNLRERWHVLQLQFVDDPKGVAQGAGELVDEALQSLRAALHERKRALDTWNHNGSGDGKNDTADTEELRQVVQHYREFFEKVVAC